MAYNEINVNTIEPNGRAFFGMPLSSKTIKII
jgi:hypothetical protein